MDINMDVTVNFEFLEENWDIHDLFILEGSTRSSKTISIIQKLILICLDNPGIYIRCCRWNESDHVNSTILDMDMVLGPEMMDLSSDDNLIYRKTVKPKEYTFFNGAKIVFSGMSDIQKIHGMKQDILWLNEVMEATYEAYNQLAYRTSMKIIMDFNPSYNRHWVFKQIMERVGTYAYQKSTYKDNPFLPAVQIEKIERSNPAVAENVRCGTADPYYWAVYGLGERGKIKGAVFNLWEITDFWPTPEQSMMWGYGLDFGFQNHPSALIECHVYNRGLYLRERVYETQLQTGRNITVPHLDSLEQRFEELRIDKSVVMVADCADPKAIALLRALGYNIIGVKKGKGSILSGINLMKRMKIYIHRGSTNLQSEFEHYKWGTKTFKDSGDQNTMEPVDKDNHGIDGSRYWTSYNLLGDLSWLGGTDPNTTNQQRRSKPNVKTRVRDRYRPPV